MSIECNMWKVSVNEELQKNPKLKTANIEAIQVWLRSQPAYPSISDNQVIIFLHAGGYDLEETKKIIENYYTLRTQYKHYFSKRDPLDDKINQTLNVVPHAIHGNDIYGRRVLWSKLQNCDASIYHPTTATKLMFMIMDVDQLENGTVPGYTLVLDGKGFGFSHAMRCSFANGRQVVAYIQTATTVLIEKVYLINTTPAAEKLISILKPFIRSDLFNKVTICSNKEKSIAKIYETIPKEVIPEDYNGDAPSMKILAESCREKLRNYRDWFLYEESFRIRDVNKENQLADLATNEKFEMGRSFKTLAID